MCDQHAEKIKELRERQEALNDEAPGTFKIENDIETAYRMAFLAATLKHPGWVAERAIREAQELLEMSGYYEIRVRQLDRLRREAEVTIDVMRFNAHADKEHAGEAVSDFFARAGIKGEVIN
jgi:hypothetical protein